MAPMGQLLPVTQAAAYLGISVRALQNMVARREIAFHQKRPRGRHYFYERELDAYRDGTRVETREPEPVTAPGYGRNVDHLISEREF